MRQECSKNTPFLSSFCQGVLGFDFYFILPCCPISLRAELIVILRVNCQKSTCQELLQALFWAWHKVDSYHVSPSSLLQQKPRRVAKGDNCTSSMIFDSYSEITHHTHTGHFQKWAEIKFVMPNLNLSITRFIIAGCVEIHINTWCLIKLFCQNKLLHFS